jgi:HEAT repeat protein
LAIVNNKKKAALGLTLTVLACVIVWTQIHSNGPVIRGRGVGDWLLVLSKANAETDAYNEAVRAVQETGTNALPLMLEMLQARDSALKDALGGQLRKQHVLHLHWRGEWETRLAALRGFQLLGPTAQPAIPSLGKLMLVTNVSREAAMALVAIGRPAMQELRNALTSDVPQARQWAAWGIGELHFSPALHWTNHPEDADCDKTLVAPLLLRCSLDTNTGVRNSAKAALLRISRADPGAVLPELSKAIGDPNKDISDAAGDALAVAKMFETRRGAVPEDSR